MKKKLDCILLIDDDEPTNFLNKLTLEQSGCAKQVFVAQSGLEALEYLRGENQFKGLPRPDLIFLDINMPAMDGWEFLENYRGLEKEQKADIIVIMLTTSLNPDDEIRTKDFPEIGGFENKPLLQNRLESILEKFFRD